MSLKSKKHILILILCAVFLSAQYAGGNDAIPPNTKKMTLQDVLIDVTKTNPSILEAIEYYKGVVAERKIATSGYLPTIGTKITVGPERTEGVSTEEEVTTNGKVVIEEVEKNLISTTATLYARQNLYNGGNTKAFIDETDARIKAAAYEVLHVANSVYLETAEAYINVVKAARLLDIAKENALTQEKIMHQVREKTDAGFNRVSELYNSESRLALSKGSYISRQQDLNQALTIFHHQFGRYLGANQFVQPKPSYTLPNTVQHAVEIAFQNHPALKVAEHNIETKKYAYERAASAYLPTLDLELQGQYRDDTGGEEGDTTQVGAYLSFNYTFFDGGIRSGEKLKNKQAIRKEHQRAYIERRNVNETVQLAWNIMEAEQQKQDYLKEHVMLSEKTLEAFKEEYYVGRRTLLDLLNMENEYTSAKLSQAESRFLYLVSIYRIMQATGKLLDEHDTGLRALVGLSKNEEDIIDEEVYEDLTLNRDQDNLDDAMDQCDNSNPNYSNDAFGCNGHNIIKIGYRHDKNGKFLPYIKPKKSTSKPQ